VGSVLDLGIIGIYLCVLVAVGVVFGRIVKTGGDYFRAGGRGSWWLVGYSMFMSGISAFTFVGNAAGIYLAGWSPLSIYLANVAGFIVASCFAAAWYRQMRVVTFAEILKERFGKTAEQVVAYLLVLNGFIFSGVGLYTLAVFSSVILPDVSVQAIVVAVGIIVVLYCTIGGSWAVMANDFVQGLVLISVTVIVTIFCFINAGGIRSFFSAVVESDAAAQLRFITPVPEGETMWTAKYGVAWLVVNFVVQFTSQLSLFTGVRYFSAKDGREAQKASILGGVLMTLGFLIFFIPPIYARVFLSEQVMAMSSSSVKAVEYAYAVASYHVLPKGIFSLMLVAIFAAAISSLDTGLNRNAGLIVRDLLPPLRRMCGLAALPASKEVFLGKLTTVFSGIFVVGIALLYSMSRNLTLFDLMLHISGRLIFPQMIPLVLFLFVRRVPRWALLSSIACGYIPSLIELTLGLKFSYQIMGISVLVGGCAGFFISCLFWRRTSAQEKEETAAFYQKMHKPVDFDREIGEENDSFQLIQIGRFAVLMGSLILLLLVPLNTPSSRWAVLAISIFIGGTGLHMIACGRRKKKS
jgi:SSS family solute:Na+ symporter